MELAKMPWEWMVKLTPQKEWIERRGLLIWLAFFLAQELLPLPVHIPRTLGVWVCIPLTLVLPVTAIVLGIMAMVRLHAAGVQRIGFDQMAAMCGAILGGVVLFLCLLVALWIVSFPG